MINASWVRENIKTQCFCASKSVSAQSGPNVSSNHDFKVLHKLASSIQTISGMVSTQGQGWGICTIGGGRRTPTESTREEWRPTGERKQAIEKNSEKKGPQPDGSGRSRDKGRRGQRKSETVGVRTCSEDVNLLAIWRTSVFIPSEMNILSKMLQPVFGSGQ